MRAAYRVAQVKAAEALLMAKLPPGTLMMRAAYALARRCALLLGGAKRSNICVAGQQGRGDRAALAARGAGVVYRHALRDIARDCAAIAEALIIRVRVGHQQRARLRFRFKPERVDRVGSEIERHTSIPF